MILFLHKTHVGAEKTFCRVCIITQSAPHVHYYSVILQFNNRVCLLIFFFHGFFIKIFAKTPLENYPGVGSPGFFQEITPPAGGLELWPWGRLVTRCMACRLYHPEKNHHPGGTNQLTQYFWENIEPSPPWWQIFSIFEPPRKTFLNRLRKIHPPPPLEKSQWGPSPWPKSLLELWRWNGFIAVIGCLAFYDHSQNKWLSMRSSAFEWLSWPFDIKALTHSKKTSEPSNPEVVYFDQLSREREREKDRSGILTTHDDHGRAK